MEQYEDEEVSAEEGIRGLTGLSNLGNTCYMNAALQCLLNTPALTDFFLTCPGPMAQAERNGMAKAFKKLVEDVLGSDGGHVAPHTVLYALKSARPMFRGYHQHDSQEFLRCLMDLLHEELMEPVADQESSEDEENDGDESTAAARDQQRLDSASSELGSPVGSDGEEYETADSGVSETSDSSSHEEETKETTASRKRRSSVSISASDGSSKREREDLVSCDTGIGGSTLSSTLSASAAAAGSSGSGSETEQDFADAASDAVSTTSGSSATSPRPLIVGPRSPAKVLELKKRRPKVYKSVISDIFDGKLVSSVQCLTCTRISMTTEVFQDLSLPIPTPDTLAAMRSSQQVAQQQQQDRQDGSAEGGGGGWLWWMWSWISGWFYGPNITLIDCLSYFFSADELKGDNMYSCDRCKKLRNGLKFSRVIVLPDTLCIHLKRFRHDFAFSSKISSRVTFPLIDLDMSPWLHKDSYSTVSMYDLSGVICHHGSAGGGHYTAYALNPSDLEWYEFDDSVVTRVEPATVLNSEAYVLFYRKNNSSMDRIKEAFAAERVMASLVHFYVSKQWLNKLENFAEPGPIDNLDFLCHHGGVLPTKTSMVSDLCVPLPQPAWNLLRSHFGGGPACTRIHECATCRAELNALTKQKTFELEEFKTLHAEFQNDENHSAIYYLSSSWFKLWEAFVMNRQRDPPGPIDNKAIITSRGAGGGGGVAAGGAAPSSPGAQQTLRQNSDYVQLSHDIWTLLHSIYGGGPEVVVRANGIVQVGATNSRSRLPSLRQQ